MIFLSLNIRDKSVVEPIAIKLSAVYGNEKVFYDGWTGQPCEGIVGKNDRVLEKCEFFFFFVSKSSLDSDLIKLEWQKAIYEATNNGAHLIPVKLDDCLMPQLFLQTLYIDIFGSGPDYGLRQMIDVINKTKNITPAEQTYENVRGYKILSKSVNNELFFEVRAETYVEPISKYIVLLQHNEDEIEGKCTNNVLIQQVFVKDVEVGENYKSNGIYFELVRPIAPGFPIKFLIKSKSGLPLRFNGIMREISENKIRHIPITDE
ncbi:MAG: toll/interleukin-1 receptor domain-containing protein [Sphingobacteriales bacterium]